MVDQPHPVPPQQAPSRRQATLEDALLEFEEPQLILNCTISKLGDGSLLLRGRALVVQSAAEKSDFKPIKLSGTADNYAEAGEMFLAWATDASHSLTLLTRRTANPPQPTDKKDTGS